MNSNQLKRIFMYGLIFSLSLVGLYGCGSDSGTKTGQVTIGLTDGAGDFATYNVGVTSITLTTEDGVEVEVLPENVMVDFAQYEDTTELVVTTDVPVGVYTGVTVTLDYTDVDVSVTNGEDEIVGVDVLVDANGDPMTQVSVHVTDMVAVEVTQGSNVYVSVDYDLALSHGSVVFDGENGTVVVVTPHVTVNVDYNDLKTLRVRGTVIDVLPEDGEFYLELKPFFINLNHGYHGFGEIMVASQDTTIYHINGQTYTGQEGIEALAAAGEGTPVIAKGQVAFEPFRLMAEAVYAGTSIPGMDSDFVTGFIMNIGDNTLMLSGMVYDHMNQVSYYDESADVTVSDATTVTNIYGNAATLEDLYLWQYIMVSGDLTDAEGGPILDATQGDIWMYKTW